jgi:hypothetical protein
MVFPIVASPDHQEPWFVWTWICTISESVCVNFSFSGLLVLEKIFKWPYHIFAFLWLSPLWRWPGPWFVQFWIPLPKDDLYYVWLKLACWF